jgi:mannose-6-phosphate isomerase-like protein (cupin superfamily)
MAKKKMHTNPKTSARKKAKTASSHSRAKRAVSKHAAATAALQYIPWHTIPLEELNPLLQRQFVVGQEIMVARVLLKKGCIVPEHSHHNEQLTYILDGALKFWIDGREIVVHSAKSSASRRTCRTRLRRSKIPLTLTFSTLPAPIGSTRRINICGRNKSGPCLLLLVLGRACGQRRSASAALGAAI